MTDTSKNSLNATEFTSAVSAITSAFGDPTRRAVYVFAHESPDGATAGEAAREFDLHPNVARHHLDKLVAAGHLGVSTERGHGAGRPSKRYRRVADSMSLDLPVRHDDILIALLGRALAELGPERAAELAEEVGYDYGTSMAQAVSPPGAETAQRSIRNALHTVADALTAHGFSAHAERQGNQHRIVATHCPFGDAAVEHPVICAVDRGMVRGMLGTLVGETALDITRSRSRGDTTCVTEVEQ